MFNSQSHLPGHDTYLGRYLRHLSMCTPAIAEMQEGWQVDNTVPSPSHLNLPSFSSQLNSTKLNYDKAATSIYEIPTYLLMHLNQILVLKNDSGSDELNAKQTTQRGGRSINGWVRSNRSRKSSKQSITGQRGSEELGIKATPPSKTQPGN